MRNVVGIGLLVALLLIAPLGATSPYFLITPGGTYDIGSRVQVPDEFRQAMGRLAFTAVYEQEANWAEVARAKLRGQAEIVPATLVRPPGTSQAQVNETNRRLIDESKPIAAAVALGAAGYEVRLTGQGAEVQRVLRGLPADGVLKPGDVIVAVDGAPVATTDQLLTQLRQHEIGDPIGMTVWRSGEALELSLPTQPSPSDPTRPAVGVTVSTYQFDVQTPFRVDVDSGNVGGPSAGFMFALGIFDAITDGDLTRGNYVVGTGTIGADGVVGPVGGTAEKALAAEQDGADVFLVPQADYDEAQRWISHLKVVPVAQFEDGVRALCALPAKAGTDEPPPPVCRDRN